MKYIRTKEETFGVGDKGIINDLEVYFIVVKNKVKCVLAEEVIKESDNIEELFDEVVCFKENELHCCYSSNLEDFKTMKNLGYIIEGSIFYGAIWIKDKGLIFVAKMNKDEKWELL